MGLATGSSGRKGREKRLRSRHVVPGCPSVSLHVSDVSFTEGLLAGPPKAASPLSSALSFWGSPPPLSPSGLLVVRALPVLLHHSSGCSYIHTSANKLSKKHPILRVPLSVGTLTDQPASSPRFQSKHTRTHNPCI